MRGSVSFATVLFAASTLVVLIASGALVDTARSQTTSNDFRTGSALVQASQTINQVCGGAEQKTLDLTDLRDGEEIEVDGDELKLKGGSGEEDDSDPDSKSLDCQRTGGLMVLEPGSYEVNAQDGGFKVKE